LVSPDAWRLASVGEDPFSDRPAQVNCIEQSIVIEGEAVEISTDECSYATLVQPLQTEVTACETLRATIAHFPLVSETPATAHVVLRAGERTIWEQTIPIPTDAGVHAVEAAGPFPAGAPLYFHVHNHGANDYYLASVTAGG
jgi:hypothetical protein